MICTVKVCRSLAGISKGSTRCFAATMNTNRVIFTELTTQNMREIVPKMTFGLHKGQNGRIGVIGGSKEYTGAPYFAAFTALRMELSSLDLTQETNEKLLDQLKINKVPPPRRPTLCPCLYQHLPDGLESDVCIYAYGTPLFPDIFHLISQELILQGADLSHIFCTEAAGTPIKSYSPDLIVHPMLDLEDAVDQMKYWLPRLHSVIIGPGLGRDDKILRNVKEILDVIKEHQKPVIIDGDGLFLVTQEPSLVANYHKAILTPNVIEFERLYEAVMHNKANRDNRIEEATVLSKKLGGITIAAKGEVDFITNGEIAAKVDERGSPRRCGGQGDILAGAIGTFNYWAHMHNSSSTIPPSILSCYAGCTLLKRLNKITFDEFSIEEPGDCGRSMVTEDMIKKIGRAFHLMLK